MAKEQEEVDLTTLNFKELQEEAEARKIDITGMRSKKAIIDAIVKYEKQPKPSEEAPDAPGSDEKPEDRLWPVMEQKLTLSFPINSYS